LSTRWASSRAGTMSTAVWNAYFDVTASNDASSNGSSPKVAFRSSAGAGGRDKQEGKKEKEQEGRRE
jgi:hypothetical protein